MKITKIISVTFAILFILLLSLYLYSRYIEPNQLIVNAVELESDLIDEPIKIVFFSDTHLGEYSHPDHLNRIVDSINKEDADLVFFLGDLIDYTPNLELNTSSISENLKNIQAAYGKYGVVGNHELALENEYNYEEVMNQGNFKVLVNDYLDIPELNIRLFGLDDDYLGDPDTSLSDKTRRDAYNLFMTHEPDIVDEMDLESIQLILAGHTHGGQVSIPFLTDKIRPMGGKNYLKGLYSLGADQETKLFVTKGTGVTTLPLRFMSVPEIVSITIKPKV